ncbi:MAG: hypothetical protein K9L82_17170 [Chromatiaceae bacterium]|nr:hypothetical protein [Chromatiaceae bacterium]MCF7994028.1 hypothetical protein [Chromatiaceae bacterium]MCF8016773.1 hypothetical protein [Chromatiaceae bacterium]
MSASYDQAFAEVARDHHFQLQPPPEILVGTVRVAFILESEPTSATKGNEIKRRLAVTPGVGDDMDFSCLRDLVREWME